MEAAGREHQRVRDLREALANALEALHRRDTRSCRSCGPGRWEPDGGHCWELDISVGADFYCRYWEPA